MEILYFKKRIKTDNSHNHSHILKNYRIVVSVAIAAIEAETAIIAIVVTTTILSRGHTCVYAMKYTNLPNVATFVCATEVLGGKKTRLNAKLFAIR